MYMTAAVATSWKDLYRSSIDSPNLSPPAKFGCLMCRLRMPCVGRRSMPTLLSPRLPSARLRDQYQYLTDYSTSLRRMARPSPLQSHCNSLGLLVAMKCCRASTLDRENRIHRHQCRANSKRAKYFRWHDSGCQSSCSKHQFNSHAKYRIGEHSCTNKPWFVLFA